MATTKTIVAAGNLDIGGGQNTGYVIVQITGTFSANITPQARPYLAATALTTTDENGYDAPYLTRATLAKVAAGTAVSAAGRIVIPYCGETISLLFETVASGTIVLTFNDANGPLPTSWWA